MQQFSQAIAAGGLWQLQSGGDYFRLISCPDPVNVKFYRGGAEVASATGMDTGFYLKPRSGFDRVDITSATAQTVKTMILDGDGGYDHFNVDVTGPLTTIMDGMVTQLGVIDTNMGLLIADIKAELIANTNATKQAGTVNDLAAVSVGVAATALCAASAGRKGLRFTNYGTADIYLGGAGVTVAGGAIKIMPGATWIENEAAPAAWYGISGTAAQSLRIQEIV